MTRLTISLKEEIVAAAIEQSGINKLKAEVVSRRAALAESMRIETLGGKEAISALDKLAKKIEKQQKRFSNVNNNTFRLYSSSALTYCNLGGFRVHLYFNGQIKGFGKSVKKSPIPVNVVYAADHEFVIEFHSIANLHKEAESKVDELSAQVRSSLDSFTTIKKLLDAWPEAKDLLPNKPNKLKINLPAIQVKDLNKLIGLPKGEK